MSASRKIMTVSATNIPGGLTKITRTGRDLTFTDVLASRLEADTGMTFSAHAISRLTERGISLRNDETARLSNAVKKAEEKGSDDSLILLDDKAFIVSIKNSKVVTAMTGDSIKGNVFTNIDSTVIA